MPSLVRRAAVYFDFAALDTNWRTEIIANITGLMTMVRIVFVDSSILHERGMPLADVAADTCVSGAFGMLLLGVVTRYPVATASGMGIDVDFVRAVVKGVDALENGVRRGASPG